MHKITWCKFILLATDFLTLFSSLFIAYEVLDIARSGRFYFLLDEFDAYVLIHACVSLVGVLWFWIRQPNIKQTLSYKTKNPLLIGIIVL